MEDKGTLTCPEIVLFKEITDEPVVCLSCSRSIYRGIREYIRFGCWHEFCLSCAKYFAEQQNRMGYYLLSCPICLANISNEEAIRINPELQSQIESRSLDSHIPDNSKIIECPKCKVAMIIEPGKEAQITKDQKGDDLSPAALDCLRRNRFRCVACNCVFCGNCLFYPYHEAYTCEEQDLINRDIVCRFCLSPVIGGDDIPANERVCGRPQCASMLKDACMHICECGHACSGTKNESEHFGCSMCGYETCICGDECCRKPSIRLKCGHTMHLECAKAVLAGGQDNGRIILPKCGTNNCSEVPVHSELDSRKWVAIKSKIEEIIKRQAMIEKLDKEQDHVNNPNDRDFYQKPLDYARHIFVFYKCTKCRMPYYGGHAECGDHEELPDELLCPSCQRNLTSEICPIHNVGGMSFKCMFCCNQALYICYGNTTYFCAECHKRPQYVQHLQCYPECNGNCAFAPHPPNGERVKIGYCAACEAERETRRKKK